MEESSGGTDRQKSVPRNDSKSEDENLIVALRVRPMNEEEIIEGATPVAHKVDERMVVLLDPTDDPDDILRVNRSREKQFMFDVSFDGSATQKEVYEKTTKFLIPSVVNGFNATVFAYGATGAGKTYTMLGTADERGIMARTLNDLFVEMDKTREDMVYKVTVSFLEIYNEMIRDLLRPSSGVLDLREDAKGVQVAGLSRFQANSSREIMDILFKGNKQRTQEPTAANKTSSRSHAVLQITVRQKNRVRDNTVQEVRVGKLFLIDLAGSERAANTQNRGKRMVEGAHINRSLLALGNCINALSDKHARKYINYRDSKLTRLLKDALGGNCKTVMIATISPASLHFEESRNTLLYADRAKNIKTKVRRNVMDVSYHIAQYSNIIAELREEIKRLRTKLDHKSVSTLHSRVDLDSTHKGDVEKLKNQLMHIFTHQMDLRRSLMEMDNKSMEMALEESKNNFVIQKWEREKAIARRRGSHDRDLNKYSEHEKDMDLGGYGTEEPDDVIQARDDMMTLSQEEARLLEKRDMIMSELDSTKHKASKIEQMLPSLQSTADQQEILRLLCKIHELEMENIHMQSSCLLRNMDIRQREMALEQYKQHHSLADELIQQQRSLMDQSELHVTKDLDELYELYQQEGNQIIELQFSLPDIYSDKNPSVMSVNQKAHGSETVSELEDSGSTVHLPKIFVPSNGANSVARKNLLKKSSLHINKLEEQDTFFAKSPRALQLDPRISDSTLSLSSPPAILPVTKSSRQKSILTLSSRSAATTPSPPAPDTVTPSNNSNSTVPVKEDRKKIAVNTRSIAALAAKRKHVSGYGTNKLSTQDPAFFLTQTSMGNQRDNKLFLTQSRLAQHDETYGSTAHLSHLDDDFFSNSNESEPIPRKTPLRKGNLFRQEPAKKKANRKQKAPSKDMKPNYQQLSKVPPKKHNLSSSSVNSEMKQPSKVPTSIYPRGFPRTKLHHINKQEKQSIGETTQRTENTEKEPKPLKKALPSIPTYRKGDISITGHGIH